MPLDKEDKEIRLGSRVFPISNLVQPDNRRSVYRVFHRCFTLDSLYNFGDRQSWWWSMLDAVRKWWPTLFLPRACVIKVYEPSHEKGGIEADQRMQDEVKAYTILQSKQGRQVPRYYGSTEFDGSPALVLQCIHGVTLENIMINNLPESESTSITDDLDYFVKMLNSFHIMGDIRPDNFIWTGQHVIGVDFDVEPHLYTDDSCDSINAEGLRVMKEDFKQRKWCRL